MLISFIIPVYNVEKYLSTCLDSILNQGLKSEEFEIILVEDRSTDNSLRICKDYCAKYTNIVLIENERNLGPGQSRNKGLFASKGDYLHFVDSDDFLFPDSVQNLLALNIISESPDVIRFRISNDINCISSPNNIIYKGRINDYGTLEPNLSAWRYWFRRQYIIDTKISFQDKKTGQDALFTFTVLAQNPFVIFVSTNVYYYRKNYESITSNKDISYVHCLFEIIDEIKERSANSNLTQLYINEIYKDIIARFYASRRTYQECVMFKRKIREYKQYELFSKGKWYLQLSRVPLLLHIHLLKKVN